MFWHIVLALLCLICVVCSIIFREHIGFVFPEIILITVYVMGFTLLFPGMIKEMDSVQNLYVVILFGFLILVMGIVLINVVKAMLRMKKKHAVEAGPAVKPASSMAKAAAAVEAPAMQTQRLRQIINDQRDAMRSTKQNEGLRLKQAAVPSGTKAVKETQIKSQPRDMEHKVEKRIADENITIIKTPAKEQNQRNVFVATDEPAVKKVFEAPAEDAVTADAAVKTAAPVTKAQPEEIVTVVEDTAAEEKGAEQTDFEPLVSIEKEAAPDVKAEAKTPDAVEEYPAQTELPVEDAMTIIAEAEADVTEPGEETEAEADAYMKEAEKEQNMQETQSLDAPEALEESEDLEEKMDTPITSEKEAEVLEQPKETETAAREAEEENEEEPTIEEPEAVFIDNGLETAEEENATDDVAGSIEDTAACLDEDILKKAMAAEPDEATEPSLTEEDLEAMPIETEEEDDKENIFALAYKEVLAQKSQGKLTEALDAIEELLSEQTEAENRMLLEIEIIDILIAGGRYEEALNNVYSFLSSGYTLSEEQKQKITDALYLLQEKV